MARWRVWHLSWAWVPRRSTTVFAVRAATVDALNSLGAERLAALRCRTTQCARRSFVPGYGESLLSSETSTTPWAVGIHYAMRFTMLLLIVAPGRTRRGVPPAPIGRPGQGIAASRPGFAIP